MSPTIIRILIDLSFIFDEYKDSISDMEKKYDFININDLLLLCINIPSEKITRVPSEEDYIDYILETIYNKYIYFHNVLRDDISFELLVRSLVSSIDDYIVNKTQNSLVNNTEINDYIRKNIYGFSIKGHSVISPHSVVVDFIDE